MTEPKHPNWHPLRWLFGLRKFTAHEGMDWLQAHGHISDHCIEPEDVAACDVRRVLDAAGFGAAYPTWK